jgi:LL-diaminopimelate aminotransferase
VSVPIRAKNNYLIDFSEIPSETAKAAKAIFLNYPNNPTGAVADSKFFRELVAWAKQYDVAVAHDNPYSEVVFGAQRLSFLATEGARDVGVEFNSLSKPYNMTGWRIGMAMGNPEIIAAMAKVKENTDSGIFNAVQFAGIKALETANDNIDKMLGIYRRRGERLVATLKRIGMDASMPKGTFYVWAPVPAGRKSGEFAEQVLEKAGVVIAPGTGYGPNGEGFVRFSLTVGDKRLDEACGRLEKAFGR